MENSVSTNFPIDLLATLTISDNVIDPITNAEKEEEIGIIELTDSAQTQFESSSFSSSTPIKNLKEVERQDNINLYISKYHNFDLKDDDAIIIDSKRIEILNLKLFNSQLINYYEFIENNSKTPKFDSFLILSRVYFLIDELLDFLQKY
ncbi:hypothetical protein KGF54_000677 [Candida jiufengensis]|uniref:uncharacterized protein n=1 Tax=Candida jiufengensis TaxID=497108 RepID=UPI002223F693|nr:uncharacterized protein KGF54_000677 [Candida jiufengensis]KAI5956202.1 hypothetical protein KGF54_000677 [Candida jiufengensis]